MPEASRTLQPLRPSCTLSGMTGPPTLAAVATDRRRGDHDNLTAAEALELLHELARVRVSRQTLWRWGNDGIVEFTPTAGGHRRYTDAAIRDLASRLIRGEIPGASSGGEE
jgi:hypothetical protein